MRGINTQRPSKVLEAEKTERIDNFIESEKITDLPHSVATLIKNFSPLRSQRVKSSENNYVLVRFRFITFISGLWIS